MLKAKVVQTEDNTKFWYSIIEILDKNYLKCHKTAS